MSSLSLENLLITVGNKKRKTSLFVPYFIFMRLLRGSLIDTIGICCLLSLDQAGGFGSPITHFPLCYQGLLWLSKLCSDELPTWEFLGHLNPSLTEIPSINNLPTFCQMQVDRSGIKDMTLSKPRWLRVVPTCCGWGKWASSVCLQKT